MSARDQAPTARDWLLNYAGDSDWRTQVDRVLSQYRAEVLAEDDADRTRLSEELHRQIEHQKAGKARWRARAEKAEEQLTTRRAEVLDEFEALQLGGINGRVSATCADSDHPTWLRAPEDARGCPWCRVAYLEAALAVDPDPIAYGPRGYRCGCGKDAHSNLVPCTPDPKDVAEAEAAQRSVDAQFPIVAAFLNEGGESR
ncbi:hypothetical protein [Streptomyces sp. NPDC056387]|uniref:hypothetical protein n=1 Tax=Streptomyces sp. NPDC056387 TaxID=3345803 RepID=UPI0035DEE96E